MLDASGSMWGQIDGNNKIVIAREVVAGMMARWKPEIELGLMAYGHRREGDCNDIEMLVPVSSDAPERISQVVDQINPKGKTPITESVRRAAAELDFETTPATVILVTDGLETCNADPCALANELDSKGIDFTAHVVGFDVSVEESRQLRCIADNTGGQYYSAKDAGELQQSLVSVVEAVPFDDPVAIDLLLAPGEEPIKSPNANWTFVNASGADKPDEAKMVSFWGYRGYARLDAGTYIANIDIGQVDAQFEFQVSEDGPRTFQAVLNAGLLRLDALLGENAAQHASKVRWEVIDEAGSVLASAYGLAAEFVIHPGNYTVNVSAEGARNSVSFEVAVGDEIEQQIDLRAGELTFDAVLTAGGEPQSASLNWDVFSRDRNGRPVGGKVSSAYGKQGKFLLTAGEYVLEVKAGATARRVPATVVAEQTQHVQLNLDAGFVDYSAVLTAGGASVQSPSYRWEVRSMMEGDPAFLQGKAYAYGGGGSFLLPVGEYLLRFKADAFDREEMFIVIPGGRSTVNLSLNAGFVEFEIQDESGTRLVSSVSWQIHDAVSGDMLVQGFGVAGKSLLPEGTYEFRINSGGRQANVAVEVSAGQTANALIPTSRP